MLYNRTHHVFKKHSFRQYRQKLKRIHRTNFQSKFSQTNSKSHSHSFPFNLQQLRQRFLSYTVAELEPVCQQIVMQPIPATRTSSTSACPLICLFCENLIYEPITLYCGHTYCEQCIKDKESSSILINCIRCSKDIQGQVQSPIVHARENLYSKSHFLKEILERVETLNIKRENILLCRNARNESDSENYEHAIKMYSNILEKHNDDHTALLGRAKTYIALEQFDNALNDIEHVIRLKPKWAKGYYCRSQILFEMKQTAAALLSSLQGLSIDPDDPIGKQIMARHLHAVLHGDDYEDTSLIGETELKTTQTINDNTNEIITSASSDLKKVMCKSTQSMSCLCTIFDCKYLTVRDFECSICVNLLWFPVTTPCGHVFCRECLIRSIDNTQVQCPMCKTSLDEFFPMLIRSHVNQTEIISQMIESFFPNEFNERRQIHEQENNPGTAVPELLVANTNNNESNIFEIPIFVCVLALPYCPCPLHVFEPRYRLMMRRTMETQSRCFGMCQYDPNIDTFADYGTLLYIRGLVYTRDGRSIVDTIGQQRFHVIDRGTRDGYCTARVQLFQDDPIDKDEFNELFELNRNTYNRVKLWFNQLDAYRRTLISHQIEGYPTCDDLVEGSPDGPKWTWVILNLLPIESNLQYIALTSQSFRIRLQIINNILDFLFSPSTQNTPTMDE